MTMTAVRATVLPYVRLTRMHRLRGTLLMILPVWWSVLLAAEPEVPGWHVFVLLAFACVCADLAGTAINDIVDRDVDSLVRRSSSRPLVTGELTVRRAIACVVVLFCAQLAALAPFGPAPVASVLLVWLAGVAYPYAKRFIACPQLVLGFVYNAMVLVASLAVSGQVSTASLLVYAAAVAWTIGYDTIYAHQDKDDDQRAGLRSSALLFGVASRAWILSCYSVTIGALCAAGSVADFGWAFYALLIAPACHAVWQVGAVNLDDPKDCDRKFQSNQVFGVLVLLAVIAG